MNGHRLAELRLRICAAARAIADTEDRVAGTLERVAVTRPREAVQLQARAAQAREYANVERRRAAEYATDPMRPGMPAEPAGPPVTGGQPTA